MFKPTVFDIKTPENWTTFICLGLMLSFALAYQIKVLFKDLTVFQFGCDCIVVIALILTHIANWIRLFKAENQPKK